MRVRRLAAAGDAGPGQVLARVAPRQLALLPRHADHFRGHAMRVAHRLRAEVADAGLDVHPAVGFDHEEAVEADRAGDERAHRHADAADLRALALPDPGRGFPLVPLEELAAAIERLLDEGARGVCARALRRRGPEHGLAFGRVDPPDRDLIDRELARGLREERLHQRDALHAARLALRPPRRGVGDHRHAAPAHRRRLIQQRDDAARLRRVADRSRSVLADDEHVNRRDLALFVKPTFIRPWRLGRAPPM